MIHHGTPYSIQIQNLWRTILLVYGALLRGCQVTGWPPEWALWLIVDMISGVTKFCEEKTP
jgi:hypothetical protein